MIIIWTILVVIMALLNIWQYAMLDSELHLIIALGLIVVLIWAFKKV